MRGSWSVRDVLMDVRLLARFNAGTYETAVTQSAALVWPESVVNLPATIVLHIINFAALAKIGVGNVSNTTPSISPLGIIWSDTTNQITDIQLRADLDGGTGQTFGASSELEIYGRNFND